MVKGKLIHGFHSGDYDFLIGEKTVNGKTLEKWEEDFNIKNIKFALKEMGWDRWQWNVMTKEETKRYKNLTNFVEVFSDSYHGYLRGDSKVSLKQACLKVLNTAMKYNECEKKTGHTYVSMKGYDNGLLRCKRCGFHGYTSLFEQRSDEVRNYKFMAEHWQKELFELDQAMQKIGLGHNGSRNILILGKPHNLIVDDDYKADDKFLDELRKLFLKHKSIWELK